MKNVKKILQGHKTCTCVYIKFYELYIYMYMFYVAEEFSE